VSYTKFGNPRPPPMETVCGWVRRAWRETEADSVANSIAAAGFSSSVDDWHIARHDVYGRKFMAAWSDGIDAVEEDDSDVFNVQGLCDCLDDISIVHDDE
jgi:hypothetical protein